MAAVPPQQGGALAGFQPVFLFSDYDILKTEEYDDYSEAWRLFDVNYEGDVEKLPQDTSFRRAYAEWIRKGEMMGGAYGVHMLQDKT